MGNLEKLEAFMEMMEEWGIVHKERDQYFPTGKQYRNLVRSCGVPGIVGG